MKKKKTDKTQRTIILNRSQMCRVGPHMGLNIKKRFVLKNNT